MGSTKHDRRNIALLTAAPYMSFLPAEAALLFFFFPFFRARSVVAVARGRQLSKGGTQGYKKEERGTRHDRQKHCVY
jgi:hypothetical protein